ncbi:hypothetical protein CEXT_781011 [Caerostris extrusa]|uniref:Uncharacterized protein n=1 Tax=Caerostris extrusa TaxID=172846 RepID=A0AAV4TPJ0_CAEEX|nr:hypothetical protein CEXT_781011 [Caerostris extrusa]
MRKDGHAGDKEDTFYHPTIPEYPSRVHPMFSPLPSLVNIGNHGNDCAACFTKGRFSVFGHADWKLNGKKKG